ncbi:TIM barrel protein, partial [Rhizobium johnstonii]|uniref:TIM barrel protein n=1 Tax=Rhizobium johnstonii TaxID=3019933 RepID=UPI003F987C09
VNVISGLVPKDADLKTLETVLVDNLKYAAKRCAAAGVRLLVESINLRDIPGFFLSTNADAERILDRVGSDNLYIQYDFDHMQILQGDLIPTFIRLKEK